MSSSPPDLSLEVIPSIPSSFEGDLVQGAGLQRGPSIRHSRLACPRESGERESSSRHVRDGGLRLAAGINPDLVSYSGVSTITLRRCSMACSGSSAKPVWTGEGCTTVLRGATSHPKRWP